MQHLIDYCGLENGCCDAYAGGQVIFYTNLNRGFRGTIKTITCIIIVQVNSSYEVVPCS